MSHSLRGFGVCTHLENRKGGWIAEELIPRIAAMGATTVRNEILWRNVETAPGRYVLPEVDQHWLQLATEAGLDIILLLCYGNPIHADPLDRAAYARYVSFLVRAMRPYRVVAYELWNEPTNFYVMPELGGPWSGRPPCPWLDRYAELVKAGAAAIKAEAPDAPVLINPGEVQFAYMAQAHPESLVQVDGIAHHPYANRFPPETIPWGGEAVRRRDGIDMADDQHSFLSLWDYTRAHSRRTLGRELDCYITEVGYTTYNHHRKPGAQTGHTPMAQAAYLLRVLAMAMASDVLITALYDFMDDGLDIFEQEHNFGIIRHQKHGWEPKPAYHALQRLSACLGEDWRVLPVPPVALDCPSMPMPQNQDEWQSPVIEPHLRIVSPQQLNFARKDDAIVLLWRGGRISGEYNETIGDLVWPAQEGEPGATSIEDLVTGKALLSQWRKTETGWRLPDLPIGGNPIAVRIVGGARNSEQKKS